jgi:hypothetical protein
MRRTSWAKKQGKGETPRRARENEFSVLTIGALSALFIGIGGPQMSIKLISHDKPEEFGGDGGITSQVLADGLIHLHEEEPAASELMAQMVYEDFVKNR